MRRGITPGPAWPGAWARYAAIASAVVVSALTLVAVYAFFAVPTNHVRAPVAAAIPAPDFSLTVSPAKMIIAPGDVSNGAEWRVTNHGTQGVPTIVVTTSEPWATVTPQTFQLAAGASQHVHVAITKPSSARAYIVFTVPASQGPGVNFSRGLAALLVIQNPVAAPSRPSFPFPLVIGLAIAAAGCAWFALERHCRRRLHG
jgi:hypothetical protein